MNLESVIPNALAGEAPALAGATGTSTGMDDEVFAGFYARSARPLWAYLARVSSDPTLADDLLQEAYIRFLTAATPRSAQLDGEVAARRYLFRIATNLLRDHWRRPRAASLEDVPERHFEIHGHAALSESRALLGPLLIQLRPRERQLLWLAYAEGYSHHEIAHITGLASASIRLLLFRARRKAARLLEPPSDRRSQ